MMWANGDSNPFIPCRQEYRENSGTDLPVMGGRRQPPSRRQSKINRGPRDYSSRTISSTVSRTHPGTTRRWNLSRNAEYNMPIRFTRYGPSSIPMKPNREKPPSLKIIRHGRKSTRHHARAKIHFFIYCCCVWWFDLCIGGGSCSAPAPAGRTRTICRSACSTA